MTLIWSKFVMSKSVIHRLIGAKLILFEAKKNGSNAPQT